MGVPIVTQVGSTVVGRAGLCQALNLGLPELVGTTPDEFVNAATRLAQDLEQLATLRGGLRERLRLSALMDGARFARNLETQYREAWRRWCAGGRV
jgi:protein O-GlcNAc transferase